MEHQDLVSGFVRLHVLHPAAEGELCGQWMIEGLARHGYGLRPGTLCPMLRAMEERRVGRTVRRLYRATALGCAALDFAREKARELFGEIPSQLGPASGGGGRPMSVGETGIAQRRPSGSVGEVFRAFLKLGLTFFGGPVAQLGKLRAEFVERRRWFDERTYSCRATWESGARIAVTSQVMV